MLKKICFLLCLLPTLVLFSGCEEMTAQMETLAQQVDVEAIVTTVIESIDWEELKDYARQGYDALVARFPALASDNVKAFLKENGLKLMNQYLESSDTQMQENARKLGDIIKILNPELTDDVNAVIAG